MSKASKKVKLTYKNVNKIERNIARAIKDIRSYNKERAEADISLCLINNADSIDELYANVKTLKKLKDKELKKQEKELEELTTDTLDEITDIFGEDLEDFFKDDTDKENDKTEDKEDVALKDIVKLVNKNRKLKKKLKKLKKQNKELESRFALKVPNMSTGFGSFGFNNNGFGGNTGFGGF